VTLKIHYLRVPLSTHNVLPALFIKMSMDSYFDLMRSAKLLIDLKLFKFSFSMIIFLLFVKLMINLSAPCAFSIFRQARIIDAPLKNQRFFLKMLLNLIFSQIYLYELVQGLFHIQCPNYLG